MEGMEQRKRTTALGLLRRLTMALARGASALRRRGSLAGVLGALAVTLCLPGRAQAVPMAPELMAAKIELPGQLAGYMVLVDNMDANIYYVAPRAGRLGMANGMPELSFAKVTRGGQTFGIVNAIFDFAIDAADFDQIRAAIKEQNPNARLKPMPFSQTTPKVAIAGFGADDKACFEAEDIITGEKLMQCIHLAYRELVAQHGPTLGEKLSASLVLSPTGVEIMPPLLQGGAGFLVHLEALYRAATPAFKATIDADVKKLYESYAWYAGYHDGICTDIAVSDFFENEVLCTSNNLNSKGGPCSIKVTYQDQHGNTVNNLFDVVPSTGDDAEEWLNTYSERARTLWTTIDGLRARFEKEFLEPIQGRKAEVSREATRGFALRADRTRSQMEGSWHFERDMLGAIGSKRTTIPGYSVCVKVDGSTGAVSRSGLGDCPAYYNGEVTPEQLIPVVPELERADERAEGDRVLDWDLE